MVFALGVSCFDYEGYDISVEYLPFTYLLEDIMMQNDTNPNPIFLFQDFSENFGAIFGKPINEDKYRSLFVVIDQVPLYDNSPRGLKKKKEKHPRMFAACEAGFNMLGHTSGGVIPDAIVPDECRRHYYFDADGALNHINPDKDGRWVRLTGVTFEEIQNTIDRYLKAA